MASPLSSGNGNVFNVHGLVVVITGGGTGLGAIMARALASRGATVFILGRRLEKLQNLAEDPSLHLSGRMVAVECDVTKKESLEIAANFIAAEIGYVNLVIANAGVQGPLDTALNRATTDPRGLPTVGEVQTHLWQTSMDEFTNTYRVNVAGAHFTIVAFLGLLDKGNAQGNVKQTSQVIITGSIGGYHRGWTSCGIAYTTSKAATEHLVKNLASFFIQFKIRVNGLVPGLFASEMFASVFGTRDMSIEGSLPASIQPLTRTGTEDELSGTILYMASEAGGYCAGSMHLIDGGRLGSLPGATW